jgi:hypothetical protein
LGLATATSLAAGVFFAAIGLLFIRNLTNRIGFVVAAIFSFSLCVLPILVWDPDAIFRFSAQIRYSTVPLWGLEFGTILEEMYKTFWLAGKYVTLPAVYLCSITVLIAFRSRYRGTWFKLLVRCCLFFPFACFVWTYQFRYLVFPLLISTISSLVILSSHWEERWARLGLYGFVLTLLPHFSLDVGNLINAVRVPESARPEMIRETVIQHLNPKARLAISSDQYFTFRPYREVSMAYYVCDTLEKYDAIFISAADITTPDLRAPCYGKRELFEVDLDLRTPYSAAFWGGTKMAGGVLYRKAKEQTNDSIAQK